MCSFQSPPRLLCFFLLGLEVQLLLFSSNWETDIDREDSLFKSRLGKREEKLCASQLSISHF